MSDFWFGYLMGIGSLCLIAYIVISVKPEKLMTKTMDYYFKVIDKRNNKILKDAKARRK